MKYDTSIYRGVFCALNAIYDENDNINTNAVKALVAKYKQLGVNGIYACGSTGEGFLLSTDERMQVAEAVKEAAGDDMAVIVHVGAASTKEACILARHAEKIGVSAVSAVPSVYYRLSEAPRSFRSSYTISHSLPDMICLLSFLKKWQRKKRL